MTLTAVNSTHLSQRVCSNAAHYLEILLSLVCEELQAVERKLLECICCVFRSAQQHKGAQIDFKFHLAQSDYNLGDLGFLGPAQIADCEFHGINGERQNSGCAKSSEMARRGLRLDSVNRR